MKLNSSIKIYKILQLRAKALLQEFLNAFLVGIQGGVQGMFRRKLQCNVDGRSELFLQSIALIDETVSRGNIYLNELQISIQKQFGIKWNPGNTEKHDEEFSSIFT